MSKTKIVAVCLAVLLLILVTGVAGAGSSASYAINWQVLSGGGAPASGGNVSLNATLGQTAIGPSSGGNINLGAGYWHGREKPTAISLVSFTAQAGIDQVALAWETGTELDNAGFNLYRATAGGPYSKINEALIAAEGDPVSGAGYSFVDTPGAGVFYYKLEDIDLHGLSTTHGPVEVTVEPVVDTNDDKPAGTIYLPIIIQ